MPKIVVSPEAKEAAVERVCKELIDDGAEKGTLDWRVVAARAAEDVHLGEEVMHRFIRLKLGIWKRNKFGLQPERPRSTTPR